MTVILSDPERAKRVEGESKDPRVQTRQERLNRFQPMDSRTPLDKPPAQVATSNNKIGPQTL
jgi:hypothetical protein